MLWLARINEHSLESQKKTLTRRIYAPQNCRTVCFNFTYVKEKLKFDYSTKNIPLPSERSYKLQLIEKIEMVIKRMRWKAIFQDTKKEKNNQQKYGLRSFKIPPPVKELAAFESELIDLVKNIKCRKLKNRLQNQLKEDIIKINQSDKTLVFADKSPNMYRLTKEQYVKMWRNAITSTHKKTNNNIKKRIDIKGK